MKKKRSPGRCCCGISWVDIIGTGSGGSGNAGLMDGGDIQRKRYHSANPVSAIWAYSNQPASTRLSGGAYAPSFGGGLIMCDDTSAAGIYPFDLATGVIGSTRLGTLFQDAFGAGHMFQECAERCMGAMNNGVADGSMYSVDVAGARTVHNNHLYPSVRASDGGIWRLGISPLKIYDNGTTVRADLASTVVSATRLVNILSVDGTEFWVLGDGETATDTWVAELFHVSSSGVATLVASDTLTETENPVAFTLLQNADLEWNELLWINGRASTGNGHVVRYRIDVDALDVILTKPSAHDWVPHLLYPPGRGFIAAYG
jgi:hypothetical protein